MTITRFTSYISSSLLLGWLSLPVTLSADTNSQSTTLVIDVAADAGTLAYSRAEAWTSGTRRGDTYVVSGYAYNGFSIPNGDTTASFAPDPAGSIGTIVMTGIFSDAVSGNPPVISSTHVLSLNSADGLVTQGLEGASPQFRALLGGTGQYSGSIGQVTEEVLGTNGSGGYNLRFTFKFVQLNPQDNSMSQAAQMQKAQSLKARSLRSGR